jgi:hypothetical protein
MREKRLTHIGVLSATLHSLLVSFVLAYPGVALMRVFQSFDPQRHGHSSTEAIMTALFCFVYNLSTWLLGGICYKDST